MESVQEAFSYFCGWQFAPASFVFFLNKTQNLEFLFNYYLAGAPIGSNGGR